MNDLSKLADKLSKISTEKGFIYLAWKEDKKAFHSASMGQYFTLDEVENMRAFNPEMEIRIVNVITDGDPPPPKVEGIKALTILKQYKTYEKRADF